MDHAKTRRIAGPRQHLCRPFDRGLGRNRRRAVQVNFVKGKELLVQGDPGDMMLILTEGTARVSMLTSGGREIVLAYAEPGACWAKSRCSTAASAPHRLPRRAPGARCNSAAMRCAICREPSRICLVADAAARTAAAHRRPDDRKRPRLCLGPAACALSQAADPQGCRGVAPRRTEPDRIRQFRGHEPRAYQPPAARAGRNRGSFRSSRGGCACSIPICSRISARAKGSR
jgi:hypothetical protein